jgi:hypothetical protein
MTSDDTITRPTPEAPAVPEAPATGGLGTTPGDALRALPGEASERGSRYVSAQAMQARLFSVYDAAAAAGDALALVQSQLTLTLNRSYYEPEEIEATADQLDELLRGSTVDTVPAAPVAGA